MDYPLAWIRAQFPALNESSTVFLDNAAGAQVPRQVLEAVIDTFTYHNANKGGAFKQSQDITQRVREVRAQIAEFLNAQRPENVIFGPNATTLAEMLSSAFSRSLKPGDEIIVTALDHHANIDPWRRLAERGVTVKLWPVTGEEARLELSALEPLLSPKTKLLAVTAASNALGTLTDLRAAGERVHAVGGHFMVDAVHLSPHVLPDVRAYAADALVFSPYKVFGPHLGVLYLSDALLARLPAPKLAFLPDGEPIAWEPGTQNHEGIAGFGGSLRYLQSLGKELNLNLSGRALLEGVYEAIARHEEELARMMMNGLKELGAEIYGVKDIKDRTATFSFNMPGKTAPQVAVALAKEDIAVANGHYYAYTLMMEHFGLKERGGAVRASALHYNSFEDISSFLEALSRLANKA